MANAGPGAVVCTGEGTPRASDRQDQLADGTARAQCLVSLPGVGAFREPPVFLQPGDEITIEISGFGSLTNPVRAA